MKEAKIIYDSDEISDIVSKIGNNTSIVENDILKSLNNDFSLLQELDLFSEGLDKLSSNARKIISTNNNLVGLLNNHDASMNELNNKLISLFSNTDSSPNNLSNYEGEIINIDEISLNKITDGKLILKEYINSVIFSFSYDRKLEILKKILNNNSLSMLTDNEQSDILIYQLKDILKNDYSTEISKLTKEEELEVQKDFLRVLSDNDKNIFNEIKEDSLLSGLSYFKEVSKNNNISVESLLLDDKNKDLFMKTINDLYNGKNITSLTSDEMTSFKNYIDNISTKNKIDVTNLLKDSKYSSVLKGGIFYES